LGYRKILLDLDDTLVVEEESARQSILAAADYLRRFHEVGRDDFLATVFATARERWYALPTIDYALAIGISSREALWAEFSDANPNQTELKKLKASYRKNVWSGSLMKHGIRDGALADRLSTIFIEERRSRQILFGDAKAFLDRLAGMGARTALVTNGTPDIQWQKIRKSGIEKYFESIVISGELGARKPGREIFAHALESIGADAEDSIMIGDSLDTDIKGANDFTMASVWVNRKSKENNTHIKPTYELKNLNDVMEILE